MALTATVIKKSVLLRMKNAWNITLSLSIKEDAIEVHSQDFTKLYKSIHDPEVIVKGLFGEIQEACDRYVAEQTIFDHQKLADAVSWINSNLSI